MLLSQILKNSFVDFSYRIENEREFKLLALTSMELTDPVCAFLDSPKYVDSVKNNVTMLIVTEEIAPMFKGKNIGLCICSYPREMYFRTHNFLAEHPEYGYVRNEFNTVIGEKCNISALASIASKNVTIGNNVTIEEFVVIRENTIIGDNTIIRAGAKIGSHGFEFKRSGGTTFGVAHSGGVVIGRHVEIQYNTCVDRALYPWDDTIIGDYSRIDNLVHVGHAVKLGQGVMVVANCGLGGRTVIGDETWIGFGATVINGIAVGKKARVNIGSVATKSVSDGQSVTGNFAIEHSKFIENLKNSLE